MIKLDIEKYRSHRVEITLRPNFGTSPPIKVDFITRISVDDEDYISEVGYENFATGMCHWAYGHQVDGIKYLERRERY